jgi:hypothetical protein
VTNDHAWTLGNDQVAAYPNSSEHVREKLMLSPFFNSSNSAERIVVPNFFCLRLGNGIKFSSSPRNGRLDKVDVN